MRNTNSTNGKPDKFDMFDAPKYYCFSKNKSKSNPRQTSINRQSQLDRWFTILHVEEPSVIKQIKLSQQQKKRSKNSKVSNDQKGSLNAKQMKKQKKELNNKKQTEVDQNKRQVNKNNNNFLKDEKILKKDDKLSKNNKNIFQNKKPSNKNILNIQKEQKNQQRKTKRDKLIKQYQVPKPIKLSKPKFSTNEDQKQGKLTKRTQKNQINKKNAFIIIKQSHYPKNVSAPKQITVLQATTELAEKNLKSKSIKNNGLHPCEYPIRIQRQWEIKNNKKWYSLSEQSKKKAQESMKKMKRQTRPKNEQNKSNKSFCVNNNIKKPSKNNIFKKNKTSDTKQFDL